MKRPPFAVMLRVHKQHRYLPEIFEQLCVMAKRLETVLPVYVSTDRPTLLVLTKLWKAEKLKSLQLCIESAKSAIVDSTGEHYMQHLIRMYEAFRQKFNPRTAALWDDDMLLSDRALDETLHFVTRTIRGDEDADCLRLRSLFTWDQPNVVNEAFPTHFQHWVFACRSGQRYTDDLMIHAPYAAAIDGIVRDMRGPAINYGYQDAQDRERCWERSKRAGKIDAHTLCLCPEAKKPVLRSFEVG